jgi:hypothetical protein
MFWSFLFSRIYSYFSTWRNPNEQTSVQNIFRNERENMDEFISQIKNLNEPGLENEILQFENFVKKERENQIPKKILPKNSLYVDFVPEQNEQLFKELFMTKK